MECNKKKKSRNDTKVRSKRSEYGNVRKQTVNENAHNCKSKSKCRAKTGQNKNLINLSNGLWILVFSFCFFNFELIEQIQEDRRD